MASNSSVSRMRMAKGDRVMSRSMMGAITVATSVFAYRQMDKRIDVKNLIKGKIKSKQHAES